MFTEERIGEIIKQLSELRFPLSVPLYGFQMKAVSGETRPDPQHMDGGWTDVCKDLVWGGNAEYRCFRGLVTIPEEFDGRIVEFELRTGREGEWDATNPQFTAWVDGELRHGLDVNHRTVRLSDCAEKGHTYEIFLSAFTGTQNFRLTFDARLQALDPQVTELYYDLLVPYQTARLLDVESASYLELISTLEKAVNVLDLRKPYSGAFTASIAESDAILKSALYSSVRPSEAEVACVGHTHIDVAWLWSLSVTQDKAVRSFSTVLELMERYPEYLFMSSQPQLYKYVKLNAPQVFEKIRNRVKEGRWEAEGGMWLEPDCNLASGEAFVRQFMHGKRFFQQEFGVDNEILWLPDVFGYSAALPQIMRKCGIRYFMTTKISWNDTNKLPYDTFLWKGIDGTKILTHFISTRDYEAPGRTVRTSTEFYSSFSATYNAIINPAQIKGAWQRYQQKALGKNILVSYGFGDGGGGPTEEMLEVQRRLAFGIPGCPKTRQSKAIDFFHTLEKDVEGKKLPVWTGELYLEYHRGTYTSMARNKKFNRRSEFALSSLESLSLLAQRVCGMKYPKQALYDNWEVLLRNQFHDILPGSSIKEVYEDSKAEYLRLLSFAEAESSSRLSALADAVGSPLVYNPNGQSMSGIVRLSHPQGRQNVQFLADGTALAWAEDVPSKGYCTLGDAAPCTTGRLSVSPSCLDTPFARITLNSAGQITSWFDKSASRELLQPGKEGNVLMTYEDKPFQYDNWNIENYYREKSWPVDDLIDIHVGETGPYRASLELKWRYQDSVINETMYVYSFSPRVDFFFRTDWHEDQLLLKALFPVQLNTSEATYEIQYGNVKRSTAVNTSWDAARFEVCYHKWMDLSEGGYGVSFLNDCKYGVGVEENEVGISLLKCGRYPNPDADREFHEATYSVMPHCGSWQSSGVVKEAYLLNNPLVAAEGRTPAASPKGSTSPSPAVRCSLASADQSNIMIETVKQAEDSDATIIRFYEFENKSTTVRIDLPDQAKAIWLCDMLENKQRLLAENASFVTLPVAPFEIITLLAE